MMRPQVQPEKVGGAPGAVSSGLSRAKEVARVSRSC